MNQSKNLRMQLCSYWITHPSWQELIALKWIVCSLLAWTIKINARTANSVSFPTKYTPSCRHTHLQSCFYSHKGTSISSIRSEGGGKKWACRRIEKHVLSLGICLPSWGKTQAIHQAPRCCLHVFNSLKGHNVNTPIWNSMACFQSSVPSNRSNLQGKLIYIQRRRVWVDLCISPSFINFIFFQFLWPGVL